MRRLVGASLLLAMLVAVPTIDLYAQKDKKKADADADKPAVDSSKLKGGEFVGILKTVPGTDRVFILTNEIQKLVPNGKANANALKNNNNASRVMNIQNQIANDQRVMNTARTPQ